MDWATRVLVKVREPALTVGDGRELQDRVQRTLEIGQLT